MSQRKSPTQDEWDQTKTKVLTLFVKHRTWSAQHIASYLDLDLAVVRRVVNKNGLSFKGRDTATTLGRLAVDLGLSCADLREAANAKKVDPHGHNKPVISTITRENGREIAHVR